MDESTEQTADWENMLNLTVTLTFTCIILYDSINFSQRIKLNFFLQLWLKFPDDLYVLIVEVL